MSCAAETYRRLAQHVGSIIVFLDDVAIAHAEKHQRQGIFHELIIDETTQHAEDDRSYENALMFWAAETYRRLAQHVGRIVLSKNSRIQGN